MFVRQTFEKNNGEREIMLKEILPVSQGLWRVLGVIFIVIGICYFGFYFKSIYLEIREEIREINSTGIQKIFSIVILCIQLIFINYYSIALIVFIVGPIILGVFLLKY